MTTPTRPLAAMLPMLLPHAQGCPNEVAIQQLRLAAIEWCERTRCWREILTTDVDEQGEVIVAPNYATIHEIERAEFTVSGQTCELIPSQFTAHRFSDMDESVEAGPPRYITQASPNTVTLIPYAAGTLEVSLFLKPQSGTTYGTEPGVTDAINVVPDHVFKQSAEAVVDGALARLLTVRSTDWYDPDRAAHFLRRFERNCNGSFQSEIRGQQRVAARTVPQFI